MALPRPCLAPAACLFLALALSPGPQTGAAGRPHAVPAGRPRTDSSGDPLPPGALARLGTLRLWHEGGITALALSPDGKVLATAGFAADLFPDERDNALGPQVRLWDAATGKMLRTADAPGRPVRSLSFSPDGALLAGAADNQIWLWQASTGKRVRRLVGHKEPVRAVYFSRDGRLLHSLGFVPRIRLVLHADGGELCRWDVATGKLLRSWQYRANERAAPMTAGPREELEGLGLSPDGALLLKLVRRSDVNGPTVNDRDCVLRICEVAGGKQRAEVPGLRHYPFPPMAAPASRRFAVSQPGGSWVGDAANGAVTCKLEADHYLALLFTADGKRLVASNATTGIWVWDAVTGKKLHEIGGPGGLWPYQAAGFKMLACSADGKTLAGVCGWAVFTWDLQSGRPRCDLGGHRAAVRQVGFSPDGKRVLSGSEHLYCRWDVATGRSPGRPAWLDRAFAVSADGRMYCKSEDGRWQLREVAGGKVRYTWPAAGHGELPWPPRFSPDGRLLLCVCERDTTLQVDVLEAATGKALGRVVLTRGDVEDSFRLKMRLQDSPDHLAVAPGGKYLAWTGKQGEVCLAEVASGRVVGRLASRDAAPPREPWGVAHILAFSPDGRRLAAAPTGRYGDVREDAASWAVRVWEVPSGKEAQRLVVRRPNHKPARLTGLTFSPDGRTLAFGLHSDPTVRLWEVTSGRQRRVLDGHVGRVLCLAFSPDGRALASGSEDGTVLVWDVYGRPSGRHAPAHGRSDDR
jgi:WD40 repeat protein